ncbi:MAG: nucleoside-diphosphate sugar epimerase/dehydratase [Nakamurella sp.]
MTSAADGGPGESLQHSIRAQHGPERLIKLLVFDSLVWVVAYFLTAFVRLNLDADRVPWTHLAVVAVVVIVAHGLVAWPLRLHQGRSPLASLDEMLRLGVAVAVVSALVFVANYVTAPSYIPRSIPITAGLAALIVMAWGRATVRWRRERTWSQWAEREKDPVLVVGAGVAGRSLIRSMNTDPTSKWVPVGLLDDEPGRRHLRIDRVPVLGTTDEMARVAKDIAAKTVVVAIPSADTDMMRRLSKAAMEAHLALKVLPGIGEFLGDEAGIHDVRDINLPDILGRHQVDTDLESIAGYLRGKRVLVTGAGGSIGSELCRQIHKYGPAELIMLDRDESALHAVELSISGRAMLDTPDVVLANIRDPEALDKIFDERRPQVVFHAAALKHLPMLEQYPAEAVKTNILGSQHVLVAAVRVGVERFVNVSTDKAANPTSVLGYTKRVAEGLTAAVANHATGTYQSVRFGNVLGSRGSVLTAFAAQVAAGGPVTVTDPDVERFFMTVQEAVQLVIQAGAIGRPGEVLVLDMGEPIKIADVARQVIGMSGKDVPIVFTGLRAGEKMSEELFGDGEIGVRAVHPMISHVSAPPVTLEQLPLEKWHRASRVELIDELAEFCQEMADKTPASHQHLETEAAKN